MKSLPIILLIGDSVRIAYAPVVRNILENKAEILEIKGNGKDSANVRKKLKKWLKKAKADNIDIIHFNCGLHDIKRKFNQEKNQVVLPQYSDNLKKIVNILKTATKAKLLWANTTPVIYQRHHNNKSFDRFESDVVLYNETAKKIMESENIPINNLFDTISKDSIEDCILNDGVHMTEKGNNLLANKVADFLSNYL